MLDEGISVANGVVKPKARQAFKLHDRDLIALVRLNYPPPGLLGENVFVLKYGKGQHPERIAIGRFVKVKADRTVALSFGRMRYQARKDYFMPEKQPFKRHRFPAEIILCAVRMYWRYPPSYQDPADLSAERGVHVDRSTVVRWVQKFGSELSRRTEKHLCRASLAWHVDETYIRVGGKWRYLWRSIDANGQLVDFRLTARRGAKAAKAFHNKAIERVRLHQPMSICTDKAPTYRKVIEDINRRYDPHFDYITHVDRKHLNNRVESGHAALKRLLGRHQSFRSLRSAKATLKGMETIRTIENGHLQSRAPVVRGEITFVRQVFGLTA